MEAIFDILKQSIMITFFVLSMMLLLEVITVLSRDNFRASLKKKQWVQIILAAVMGIMPGCMGTYALVSLYTHGTVGFASLVTVFIATSGDEAFVMLSMIPQDFIKIMLILFIISIVSGFVILLFSKKENFIKINIDHIEIHSHDHKSLSLNPRVIILQITKIIPERAYLLLTGILVLFLLSFGYMGHNHLNILHPEVHNEHIEDSHEVHTENVEHGEQIHSDDEGFGWENITFFVVILLGLLIILIADDHFLHEHLWGHVIKKHLPKLFAWTFGAFILLFFINSFLDVESWIKSNIYIILLIAILIGIIPESGPHIIFISLYASGVIPLSILIANSIVQDGHGSIPLLAESRKSFFKAKVINFVIGGIVGLVMLLFENY